MLRVSFVSGVLGCTPELWSKMGLGTDNLDRARQKEEQSRGGN